MAHIMRDLRHRANLLSSLSSAGHFRPKMEAETVFNKETLAGSGARLLGRHQGSEWPGRGRRQVQQAGYVTAGIT
jgi:hypothetical protein